MKNDRDERTRPHVPTSPEECDPNSAAVKSIKAKVSDIDKMKVEEQKKAARAG